MTNDFDNQEFIMPEVASKEQQETIHEFVEKMTAVYQSKQYSETLYIDLRNLERATRSAMESAGYSPQMGEQALDNLLPTLTMESSEIQTALLNPRQNEDKLRQVSRTLEAGIMAYNRVVSFLSDIKTFKYFLKCDTPLEKKDISSSEYKKSKKDTFKKLKSLNIPYQAKLVDRKTVSEGISFWLYYEQQGFTRFLMVPTEYCYVTGPSTLFGYTWALDLTFLDRFMYLFDNLPELNFAYLKYCKLRAAFLRGAKDYMGYPIDEGTIKTAQYYSVSKNEGCCVLFNEASGSRIPIAAGAMPAAVDMMAYRSLLKQKATADLYTLVVHKIPRDAKTGKLLATFEEAQAIIRAIQSISPTYIKHTASIFEDPTPVKLTTSDVLQTLNGLGNDQFYDSAGMQSGVFSDTISTEKALDYAMIGTFGFASSNMYTYLTNVFNFLINKDNKSKYEWSIVFYGNLMKDSEEKADAIKFANIVGNPYLLYSAYGIEPFNVENMMLDDLKDLKLEMVPFPTSATQTGDEGGRPEKTPSSPPKPKGKETQ